MISESQNNHDDSTELPLTEEEYEQASPELQIRSDLEVGEWHRVKNRDDVEKKFELKAGHDNSSRNTPDLRKFVQLFYTPAGWLYVVDGPESERYDLLDELPHHRIFVEDTEDFIKQSVEEHGHTLGDCYETSNKNMDIWNDLSMKVEIRIYQKFAK